MRLIDADELKENFYWSEVCRLSIKEICQIIDNAPTVDDWQKYSDELWKNAYEKGKLDRPQGEWVYIDKEDKERGYGGYCSECKCDMPIFNEDWKLVYCETNFCPNCGADMRGKKDE